MRRFDKRSPAIAGLLVFTRGAKQGRLATIDRTDRRPLPTEAVQRRQEAWVQGANAGEQPGARPHLGKAPLAPVSRLPGAKRKPRRQAGVSMRVGLPTCWRSSKITDIPQPASLDSIVVTSKLSGMLNQSKTAKTYVSSKLIDTLPTEAPA